MATQGNSTPEDQPEPPRLRFLRRLVVVMTITMIAGLIVIITLMIMTFLGTRSDAPETTGQLVDPLSLPRGEQARAYTQGTDWSAVVTRDSEGRERIHIFDPVTGEIRQTVTIQQD